MNLSTSSNFPLQPYHGEGSSILTSDSPSSSTKHYKSTISKFSNVEVSFLRVVGRNRIPIAQPEDIQLGFNNTHADSLTRSGLTMHVHRGLWRNKEVALKRIRHLGRGEGSEADTAQEYAQAMYDVSFELQIMSKKSLCDHRNITKLLAVSFDAPPESEVDPTTWFVLPILIVELADNRFPDLSLFLSANHNPNLPERLPFETAGALIADIADGVQALHNHEVVHADLKPQNILIFVDRQAPCGFVAKIADFGFSGMATYTNGGKRVWLPDSSPRGGTAEWNAPECIEETNTDTSRQASFRRKEQPRDMASRDIYSFGLLSSYIALDGQTPKSYITNLREVKLSDGMVEAVKARVKEYHLHTLNDDRSLGNLVARIVDMTLLQDHTKRENCLGAIRQLLFGSNPYEKGHPTPEPFVLNFDLFPKTAHEFKCDGLHAAYWQSPPAFRSRVFDCFKQHSSGIFGQYVAPEIWACLEEKEGVNDVAMLSSRAISDLRN